jgi:hypothetical protein
VKSSRRSASGKAGKSIKEKRAIKKPRKIAGEDARLTAFLRGVPRADDNGRLIEQRDHGRAHTYRHPTPKRADG